jgi:peptide/nickel transport system substrate-binding protein
MFIGIQDCLFNDNPGANWAIRGLGKEGYEGWPESPALEALRDKWLEAEDAKAEALVAEKLQMQLWQDVPYIPVGHWVRSAAHRTNIVDLPWGFPAFYGVRRV